MSVTGTRKTTSAAMPHRVFQPARTDSAPTSSRAVALASRISGTPLALAYASVPLQFASFAHAHGIEFVAEGTTRFVLGSAPRHPHELVLGSYSVHTSAEALQKSAAEIRRIGQQLRANGTIR
jgi:hypothetical protein